MSPSQYLVSMSRLWKLVTTIDQVARRGSSTAAAMKVCSQRRVDVASGNATWYRARKSDHRRRSRALAETLPTSAATGWGATISRLAV